MVDELCDELIRLLRRASRSVCIVRAKIASTSDLSTSGVDSFPVLDPLDNSL